MAFNYPSSLVNGISYPILAAATIFGLLVVVIMYYVFANNRNTIINQSVSSSAGSTSSVPSITQSNVPVPINGSGYYANVPATTTANSITSNSNQVFNVKENIYTLDDAPAVCGALGANLASVNQLIDAHKNGADWCNVGWTSDGLAAYPVQYSTWKTLQDNTPNTRNICGSPGINLVRNDPNLLYGVNCYGVKPTPKGNELIKNTVISDKQLALNAKIAQLQKRMSQISVAPFNQNTWSM